MSALEDLVDQIRRMSPEAKANLSKTVAASGALNKFAHWRPQEGPQTEAYFSEADMLLYGGAAGGGKTDLIAGLALFDHYRVGIFRQQAGELTGIVNRMNAILRDSGMGRVGGNPVKWDGPDGNWKGRGRRRAGRGATTT